MKTLFNSKIISVALAAMAFAIGTAPASAQSMSHYGSLLPHYFDGAGELKFGSWAPPAADQGTTGSRKLYLYVKPHATHSRSR